MSRGTHFRQFGLKMGSCPFLRHEAAVVRWPWQTLLFPVVGSGATKDMHPHLRSDASFEFKARGQQDLINNRQAGRRRGRGGQRSPGGGNPGRGPESGNRIDNRARGNAAQLLEKYKTLARDAQMQGDRVNTEYYLQFADHYFRVLAETRSRFEENQPRRGQNDQFEDGDDEDFDGNTEGMADDRVDPYQPDRGNDRGGDRGNDRGNDRGDRSNNRETANRDGGNRDQNSRDGNRANGRDQNRDQNQNRDQPRDQNRDQPRDFGNRDANGNRGNGQRDGAPRDAGPRDSGPRDSGPRDGADRPARRYQADQDAPTAPPPEAPDAQVEDGADRPRRGRPRRTPAASDAPRGDVDRDIVIDADRLPPSLSLSAIVSDEAEPAEEKPRRRRKAATSEAASAE